MQERTRGWLVRGTVIGVALAALAARLPPRLVDRVYWNGLYLRFQPRVTGLSNLTSLALSDIALVLIVGWWVGALANDLRRLRWPRAVGRIALRTATLAAAAYLLFLALWGLNYRRVPLEERLDVDASRVTSTSVGAMLAVAVDRVNTLYDAAHASALAPPAPGGVLADAMGRIELGLGATRAARAGRLKTTILDWYFRRAGVQGMTDPYFLETIVPGDLLAIERPFVAAHEWAHLAGYADEGDANYVGWLACLDASPADQYSGWLFLYEELVAAASADAREMARSKLAPGPRADLAAIARRVQRDVNVAVSTAGWQAYDRYLKMNQVTAGAASYSHVVTLVVGSRGGPRWDALGSRGSDRARPTTRE